MLLLLPLLLAMLIEEVVVSALVVGPAVDVRTTVPLVIVAPQQGNGATQLEAVPLVAGSGGTQVASAIVVEMVVLIGVIGARLGVRGAWLVATLTVPTL